MKILFLQNKIKTNYYVEKGIFEKVGKCPLNKIFMLIFHIQNGSTMFQNIYLMYKNPLINKLINKQIYLSRSSERAKYGF